MIDRRTLTTLLAGAAAAPGLTAKLAWAQAAKSRAVYYAAVGSDLALYGMNVDDATLEKRGTITLPGNVQYAWPHPSRQFFYVVSSGGGPGVASDQNFANAFRIDPATGAPTPHGQRPTHCTARRGCCATRTCGVRPTPTTAPPAASTGGSPGAATTASSCGARPG